MDFFSRDLNEHSMLRCPFLRNINEPTNFSFSSSSALSMPAHGTKGPIFEDGPNFDLAFRLFHGSEGVVPLSGISFQHSEKVQPEPPTSQFNPLAAKAATISLSSFGSEGPFSFDPFSQKWNDQKRKSKSSKKEPSSQAHGTKGPIFEDGPNFDLAFRLFHGSEGVVPLSGRSFQHSEKVQPEPPTSQFNPLAAKAATISLSSFASEGPFSFDPFSQKWNDQKRKSKSSKKEPSSQDSSKHEALSNEWLQTGNCPIAKSFRAVGNVLPLVAKVFQPPPGLKYKCPPARVAAPAALARTAFAKNLRPLSLPTKVLVIGVLGMAANVPLGIWREHAEKFSPSWFAAVHAAAPFIAMLRKSILMHKTAMAFTIAASVLGMVTGSRAERYRLKAVAAKKLAITETSDVSLGEFQVSVGASFKWLMQKTRHCSDTADWNAGTLQLAEPSSADVYC